MRVIRFHAFWAINAPLDAARLFQQLERFKVAGLDGVVWHPRFYPNQPPYLSARYFEIVSEVILHAKTLGLSFWIYDENGWPSGTVGGALLEKHPELRQRWAELVCEKPERCLAEFDHEGKRWYLAEQFGAGVDYLSPDLATHFLKMTYDRYCTGLTAEAFAHVETFFCDEPEFGLGHAYDALSPDGAIPWTEGLNALYAERYGGELLPLIGDLFFSTPRSAEVRVRFWELLRDRFADAFLEPMNAWCRSHGKHFTAHIKGEEHPFFQVPMVGSCDAVFRQLSIPAIDALERQPGNDYYPRQLVTAAQQFGDGRCMVEAFGGAGWGATPADLEGYLLWLGGHGITDFVMHLSQYRLDSAAIRDWPPSQPFHLNWTAAYPELLRRVREKLATSADRKADVLVVSPHRGIMAGYEPRELLQTNIHNASTYPDSPAARINRDFLADISRLEASGVTWHVTDEATFETHARREGGEVRLGNCTYRECVVASGARLAESLAEKLPVLNADCAVPIEAEVESGRQSEIPLVWKMTPIARNSLLLESSRTVSDGYESRFSVQSELKPGLLLRFADEVERVSVNGRTLNLQREDDFTIGVIPDRLIVGINVIRFRLRFAVHRPFLWLEGLFGVRSMSGFSPKSGGSLRTAGPFQITAASLSTPTEFVSAGFPFLREPVELVAAFELNATVINPCLAGIHADAARVFIDGVDAGWTWAPKWEVTSRLDPGQHEIRLTLVPNTYNYFGPHHYYLGDRPVVSPDQFSGKKNFADPADAPEYTLTTDWHFVPLRPPKGLRVAFTAEGDRSIYQ